MYAIRSYYDQMLDQAANFPDSIHPNEHAAKVMAGFIAEDVITSYSIHYTKLYESIWHLSALSGLPRIHWFQILRFYSIKEIDRLSLEVSRFARLSIMMMFGQALFLILERKSTVEFKSQLLKATALPEQLGCDLESQ